jgi:signal transduction histidine kinase
MTRTTAVRYGLVPIAVAASTLLEMLFNPLIGEMPFLFLWPAVAVCAWVGGLGPGLCATLLGVLAADYYLVEPRFIFSFHKPHEAAWVSLFVVLGASLSVLGEQLHRLRRRLEQADRKKNEFVATLVHELRGPLSALRNAVVVLRRSPSRQSTDWALGLFDRQIDQMDRLVGDVLDISRIERGKLTLEMQAVDVATIVDLAVEAGRPLIDRRNHEFTVSMPPNTVRVEGDRKRLVQVVANLLNNAAKYTDDGGRLSLIVKSEPPEVVLEVCDTGIGIAGEMLGKIFDLYTQIDNAKRSDEGMGIGLSLVRRLVEMHDGSVEARSPGPGQGSTFIVRLPARASALEHHLSARAQVP